MQLFLQLSDAPPPPNAMRTLQSKNIKWGPSFGGIKDLLLTAVTHLDATAFGSAIPDSWKLNNAAGHQNEPEAETDEE